MLADNYFKNLSVNWCSKIKRLSLDWSKGETEVHLFLPTLSFFLSLFSFSWVWDNSSLFSAPLEWSSLLSGPTAVRNALLRSGMVSTICRGNDYIIYENYQQLFLWRPVQFIIDMKYVAIKALKKTLLNIAANDSLYAIMLKGGLYQ